MHGKLQLLVVSGVAAGKRFPVGNAPLRLGRSSASDICIVDERLSRMHCLFEPDGSGGVGIIDLASANGTTVNGRIVGGDPMPLSVGDKIEVKDNMKNAAVIKEALEATPNTPDFVTFDVNKMAGEFVRLPERNELNQQINELLVVEFYNRKM